VTCVSPNPFTFYFEHERDGKMPRAGRLASTAPWDAAYGNSSQCI